MTRNRLAAISVIKHVRIFASSGLIKQRSTPHCLARPAAKPGVLPPRCRRRFRQRAAQAPAGTARSPPRAVSQNWGPCSSSNK